MWVSAGCFALRASRFCWWYSASSPSSSVATAAVVAVAASALFSPTLLLTRQRLRMEANSSFTNFCSTRSLSSPASSVFRRGGRGGGGGSERDSGAGRDRQQGRGGRKGGGSDDKIDALGRLLTRILRHMASELNLDMRTDGYVRVSDLLRLNMTTHAKVTLRSHTVDDIKEAVRRDNKQRFSLLEENGELMIRANQGHTISKPYNEEPFGLRSSPTEEHLSKSRY